MNKVLFICFLIAVNFFAACNSQQEETTTEEVTAEVQEITTAKVTGTFVVDLEQSTFKWIGKKPTGEHWGFVKLKEGTIGVQQGKVSTGSFVADMTTISVDDIEEDEKAADLEKHLKNEDFFNVDSFPEASLSITNVMSNEGRYTIKSNLTIKNQTHPVTFQAELDIDKESLIATGRLVFDRTQYGIKYKSKSILGDAADKFIYDEIRVELYLVAEATN